MFRPRGTIAPRSDWGECMERTRASRLIVLAVLTAVSAVLLGLLPGGGSPAGAAKPTTTTTTTTPPGPCGSVEATFTASGGRAVSTTTVTDSAGLTHKVWYPTQLGTNPTGYLHPIITWGNGTNGVPDNYQEILSHWASWGYVAVAANSGSTGFGTEMWRGAQRMIQLNGDSASVFFQKLDTAKVGVSGHSQGAGGSLHATAISAGAATSTLAFNIPSIGFWSHPEPSYSAITKPVAFFTTTGDRLISPDSASTYFYNKVPKAAKAAWAGGDHNTIQNLNNPFYGYSTAWWKYTLEGDACARSAFVTTNGIAPEVSRNAAWRNWASKGLS
jgi:hypothetical protein